MGDRWRADDGIVLRTPLLPTSTLLAWQRAPREELEALLARPEIDEAIFVASPSLHEVRESWRDKPRVRHALVKYIARAAGRATPFGLFSGVSAGRLARDTRIELAPRAGYRRRTRLDNDYLFVLAAALASEHRDALVLRANDSLYRIAGRFRCAVARIEGKDRRYELISIDPTPYLESTLVRAADGATFGSLAEALAVEDVSLDEARAYIGELVAAQVLVTSLRVQVTGPEPLDALIAQLRDARLDTAVLDGARASLAELDRGVNAPAAYRAVASALEQLPAKVDLARLFQVDLVKPGEIAVERRLADELLAAVGQLARIARRPEGSLADFRRAFMERWEGREVPLAEALDEDAGIGFEMSNAPGAEGAPLLAGLHFPNGPAAAVSWRQAHLLRRLAEGGRELVLTDADFDAMKAEAPLRLPDAFAIMARPGRDAWLVQGTSGPPGARLDGRFCHASPEIETCVREHLAREEALAPAAIFAEVVHLDEGRIGNILCRPVLRSHEIVYLGASGAPRDHQLTLDDLLVSVRGDRIVLRSRRLGREIVPRLTTAHNFRGRGLGVYRFLCGLAEQDGVNVGWSWGPLATSTHLPRVRFGRLILARETWNLSKAECKLPLAELRVARALPRFVVLVDGDNELPVDLDNPLLVEALADELSGRASAELVEMFPAPDEVVAHGPEGGYAAEVVMTFVREGAPRAEVPAVRHTRLQRSYPPGGPWLYAKVYGGQATADRVLRDAIAPIVRAHDGVWFFLRYHDPDPHVRVRLRGDPARLWGETLPALERALAPLIADGVVRRLVLDTYDREVERYGGDAGMELVEELFWRDSEAVLGIVELLDGDAGADARWRLAVRGIESLLAALGLSATEREKVASDGRESLGREMRADTPLWSRIGDRFAKERASLDVLFTPDETRDADHDLEPGFSLLAARDAHIRPLADELRRRDVPIAGIAWSLVHMHANRLLHASQRAQELVLYDFLRRLHASQRSRRG